ncbi:unnamed protein product [Alopecurus aequalis]
MEMESAGAKSFPDLPVARDPPQTAQLGQAPDQCGWGRWALLAIVSVIITVRFAWGVYQARHSPLDLAYVIVTYDLIAVLFCCLVKLNLLRRDDPVAAPERRRVRIVVWVASVALAIVIAARVAWVMPNLWLKIGGVLVITGVGIGLSFYFYASADVGRQTEDRDLHEMSPEQRV